MNNIAIFGAGLLGQKISLELISRGYNVDIFESSDKKIKELSNVVSDVNFYKFDLGKSDFEMLQEEKEELRNKKYLGIINCTYPYVNKTKTNECHELTPSVIFSDSINAHLTNAYQFMLLSTSLLMYKGVSISFASIYGSKIPKFEVYNNTNMTTPPDYVASKAGIIMLSKYFASYYLSKGLRFNTISPGGVFDNQDPLFVEMYCKNTLYNQMLETQDVIGPLLYLLSDDAKMTTGQDFIVDGGFCL